MSSLALTATQTTEIARRSVIRMLRQPAQVVPALVFPLFLVAVNSGGLNAATKIPGFPTNSYLTFAIATPFIQGGIFTLLNGGTDLARDIETGFLKRLALTPISRAALVSGQLFGLVALGFFFGCIYLLVGLAAGAHFAAGIGGVPILLALAVSIAFAFGCIGMFLAARVGTGEAVQGMFPVFFMFLFFSSMAMPRNLIKEQWFHTITNYNPVSYLIEGIRSLFITGIDGTALWRAFAICAVIAVVALFGATRAIQQRLIG